MRVGRTFRLGKHIVDPHRFQYRAHGTTGDHPGTVRCGTDENTGTTVLAFLSVRNGRSQQRNADQVLFGIFNGLDDGFGHLFRFAQAVSYHAFAVAYHHDRRKTECATTLGHFGNAVYAYQTVGEFQTARFYSFYCFTVFFSHDFN